MDYSRSDLAVKILFCCFQMIHPFCIILSRGGSSIFSRGGRFSKFSSFYRSANVIFWPLPNHYKDPISTKFSASVSKKN